MPDLEPALESVFREVNAEHLKRWLPEGHPRYEHTLAFVSRRVSEGQQLRRFLLERYPTVLYPGSRILDLGSGNGGVIFSFAANGPFSCWCLDTFVHPELLEVARRVGLNLNVAVGYGESIPLATETFDLVLYLETIEHVEDARQVGREIFRILRPGGYCVVTTPARLRFLFRRDPHYRVPGLVSLPNVLQKWIVERILRRADRYDVTHIYWTVAGIMETLSPLQLVQVVGGLRAPLLPRLDWQMLVAMKPKSR